MIKKIMASQMQWSMATACVSITLVMLFLWGLGLIPALYAADTATNVGVSAIPHFRTIEGRRIFMVDHRPFLILGAQSDVWTIAPQDEKADQEFIYARFLNCNMIEVPLRWAQIEPGEGHYDMTPLKWIIDQGRNHGLKVGLLWHGSNLSGTARAPSARKKGGFTGIEFAPGYILDDPARFSRVIDTDGDLTFSLSPLDPDTLDREKSALRKLCEFIRSYDKEHTVVLIQVENEPWIVYGKTKSGRITNMDGSDQSMAKYRREGWTDPVAFSVKQLALYIKELVDVATEVAGLPTYCNFIADRPGQAAAYLETISNLTLVAPDIYSRDKPLFGRSSKPYRKFRRILLGRLDGYDFGRNIVYLSETGTDNYWRPHLTLFYVLGKYGGCGMTVWAITKGFPSRNEPPVDPKTGNFRPGGSNLAACYEAVGRAMEPIALAQGTDRFAWHVSEDGGTSAHQVGTTKVTLRSESGGAALLVEGRAREITVVGLRCRVQVDTSSWGKVSSESGAWKAGSWHTERPIETITNAGHTTIALDKPEVVRIYDVRAY